MESINVETIMAQIRQEIREKGYADIEPDFAGEDTRIDETVAYNPGALSASLRRAGESAAVNWYLPIAGNPVKVFFKKCLRKLMLFFVRPLVEQQNRYNAASMQVLAQLAAFARENEALKAEVAALNQRLTDRENRG